MKKFINKKNGEIAYLDLYTNTIKFSKSKGVYKAYIEKDAATNKISQITTSATPISSDMIKEPIEINADSIKEEAPIEIIENEDINEIVEAENPITSSYPRLKLSPNEFIKLYIETAIKDLDLIKSYHNPIKPTAETKKRYHKLTEFDNRK